MKGISGMGAWNETNAYGPGAVRPIYSRRFQKPKLSFRCSTVGGAQPI
jgi:hypothetical protein